MAWLAVVVLSIVVLLALAVIVLLTGSITESIEQDKTFIEVEVRRAERRLHDLARQSFEAMLDEARGHRDGLRGIR